MDVTWLSMPQMPFHRLPGSVHGGDTMDTRRPAAHGHLPILPTFAMVLRGETDVSRA